MIQWVLDALGDAKNVDNVIIIGLSPKSGVTCKKPCTYISNQGRMLANIVAGVNKSLEIKQEEQICAGRFLRYSNPQARNGGLAGGNMHADKG